MSRSSRSAAFQEIWHEVLESHGDRFALTLWVHDRERAELAR